jgi:hypothetical protein
MYINNTKEIEQGYASVQQMPSNITTSVHYQPDTNRKKQYELSSVLVSQYLYSRDGYQTTGLCKQLLTKIADHQRKSLSHSYY